MRHWLLNLGLSILFMLTLLLCLVLKVSADENRWDPVPTWYREGFAPFCDAEPAECAPYADERVSIRLKAGDLRRLNHVNRAVNAAVTYKTDAEQWGVRERFTYPANGFGDCEDYALEKRRRLVAAGWPRRALLLLVVDERNMTPQDELHMILLVRTPDGDLLLDNRDDEIRTIDKTNYNPLWLQSQVDPNRFSFVAQPSLRAGKTISRTTPVEYPQ